MSKQSAKRRVLMRLFLMPCTVLALMLSAGCVTRPVTVSPPPRLCPDSVIDELLKPTPGADLPAGTLGDWIAFSVQTEAARLSGNRDKKLAREILADCRARYEAAVAPKHRKLLGIF